MPDPYEAERIAQAGWTPDPSGYHQPGCASGTWLTDTLIGRIADGLNVPPTLFAMDTANHWSAWDPWDPATRDQCNPPLPPCEKVTVHLTRLEDGATIGPTTINVLPKITDAFVCVPDCPRCLGSGHVCEDHPDKPWDEGEGCCGAAGMPCNPQLRGDPSTWPSD